MTARCYLEIAPQTFSILVRPGTRLNQLRIKRGSPPRLSVKNVGVDLTGVLAGFRGRRHAGVIDLDNIERPRPARLLAAARAAPGELLLDPGEFYILASRRTSRSPCCRRPR